MKPYYQRAGVTLYHGDARDVLPGLAARGVVISDFPYSAHVHSKATSNARPLDGRGGHTPNGACNKVRKVDLHFDHLRARDRRFFAAQAKRLAARWVLAFSDTESDWLWRLSFQAAGLEYVRTAFWHKIASTPQFTGDRPAVAYEAITIVHPKGRKRWNGGGRGASYEFPIVQQSEREPRVHTTQKPAALMLALVSDFSDPGELVYDFTMGSGTTGIGCLRAPGGPRRFVGIEREEKWIEAAARRLDAELDGSTYHAAKAGQIAMFGGAGGR